MQWVKAGAVGALAALLMFILMAIGIWGTGIAPFEQPPSAAFLQTLGMKAGPLPLIVHFGYGIFWSVVLVAIFRERTAIRHGLGLAGLLWLGMMLIHSPIIGWGPFGLADTTGLPESLQLGSPIKYVVATAVLHTIYGLVIGWLNPSGSTAEPRNNERRPKKPQPRNGV